MKKLICLLIAWPILSYGQDTAVQPNVDSANFYMIQAQNQMQQGKPEEALKGFRRAAELQPENAEAYIGWFRVCMGTEQVEEGSKAIDSWIEHNPTDTQAWLYKGFLEAALKQPEEALKAFDTLIRLQPEEASNYVGRGQMLYDLERYEEALEAFDKSLSMDSTRNDVTGMKSSALARLERYDEALSTINKALDHSPGDIGNIYNRACIYSLKGDKQKALEDLKKAISLDASIKEYARTDKDFERFYNDEDFINLTK